MVQNERNSSMSTEAEAASTRRIEESANSSRAGW